jgi:hypothetical protein
MRFAHRYDYSTGIAILKIDNVLSSDQSVYAACAHNSVGQIQTQARLHVSRAPSIDQSPIVNPEAFKYLNKQPRESLRSEEVFDSQAPKVVVPLSNVKLLEGKQIHLACKIIGFPKPRVSIK